MCEIVVINRGEKEIGNPQQFIKHFGFEAPPREQGAYCRYDSCLCNVDIEAALKEHDIPYKMDGSDVYVGDLENVIGD
jgi:hypothetical protein